MVNAPKKQNRFSIHLIAVKQETKADHQSIAKTPQEPKPKYLNNTNHS